MKTQISDTKREEIVSKLQQDIDAANAYYLFGMGIVTGKQIGRAHV